MRNEFGERVAHLSTPLFPFFRVDPEIIAKWLRSKIIYYFNYLYFFEFEKYLFSNDHIQKSKMVKDSLF